MIERNYGGMVMLNVHAESRCVITRIGGLWPFPSKASKLFQMQLGGEWPSWGEQQLQSSLCYQVGVEGTVRMGEVGWAMVI